jgi:hypothetical protein
MPGPNRVRRTSGGRSFDPNNYGAGTLKGWFKADSLALSDGASVVTWPDSSANGNNASGGTSPVYRVGVQNGKPGVLFTRASSQYLTANGLAAAHSGTNLPFTVVQVARHVSNVASEDLWSWGSSTDNDPFSVFRSNGTTYQVQQRNDDASSNLAVVTGVVVNTLPHVYVSRFDGTNAEVVVDGALLAGPGACNVGAVTVDRFALGALLRGTASNFFDGHLFETIVYSSALSVSDRQTIERALGLKWGIIVA